jgi:hypothetical protein
VRENVGNDGAESLDDPTQEVPTYVCLWIFIECDIPDVTNATRCHCKDKTHSHALKMRAAVSFHYNELGRGATAWHEGRDGWIGNPSLSQQVSHYMLSLQRRKVSNPLFQVAQNHLARVLISVATMIALRMIMLICCAGTFWADCPKRQVYHIKRSEKVVPRQ